MAFSYTKNDRMDLGSQFAVTGTYTNGVADVGGDIVTGLDRVDFFQLQPTGAAVLADQPSVNETFPLTSGTVTVVNSNDEVGIWIAVGK